MKFDQKFHFKDVLGAFTVQGWLIPQSLDLDLKITRDEEVVKRSPGRCLTRDDLVQLIEKLTKIKAKMEELYS